MEMTSASRPPRPKLGMCNFIADLDRLKRFAIGSGFEGIGCYWCAL